jgi:hypothetical protein
MMRRQETLPVVNGDGSVGIMVANHAVNASGDHNGPGSGAERARWMFPRWHVLLVGLLMIGKDYDGEQRPNRGCREPGGADDDHARAICSGIS